MTDITMQKVCAEAVCAGLFSNDFVALGDSEGGAVTWFTRGTHPRRIRISVNRSSLVNAVIVTTEFPNFSNKGLGRQIITGKERTVIPTDRTLTDDQVREASTAAVLRCLEIFKDVLEGQGVAGVAGVLNHDWSDKLSEA